MFELSVTVKKKKHCWLVIGNHCLYVNYITLTHKKVKRCEECRCYNCKAIPNL